MKQNNFVSPENIIYNLDPGNRKCADCGSENPTEVSVNHGILICENCAIVHSLLGRSISYVRPIHSEWDDYLLSFILLGGNSQFIKQLEDLKVNQELSVQEKYSTYALDYYRRNLKSKVLDGKEIPIDYQNPNECIENPKNSFIEFEDYIIQDDIKREEEKKKENMTESMINKAIEEKQKEINDSKTNDKTFIPKGIYLAPQPKNVIQFFEMVGKGFKEGSQKTLQSIKKAGNYFIEKTTPASEQIKATFGTGLKDILDNIKKMTKKTKHPVESQPQCQCEYYNINQIEDIAQDAPSAISCVEEKKNEVPKMYTNTGNSQVVN